MMLTKLALTACLAIFFCYTTLIQADQSMETANHRYFHLLSMLETIKNNNLSTYVRQENMANILNQLASGNPAANWLTIKDGLLDVMLDDPGFFFAEMTKRPDLFNTYLENFALNWLYSGTSDYPEKKAMALKALEEYIAENRQAYEFALSFKKKLFNTEPVAVN